MARLAAAVPVYPCGRPVLGVIGFFPRSLLGVGGLFWDSEVSSVRQIGFFHWPVEVFLRTPSLGFRV